MAKLSRTVVYGSLTVVVAASMIFLSGGDAPAKPKSKTATSKAAAKAKETVFTEEDYKAVSADYGQVTAVSRNVFQPLVARSGARGAGASGPSGIPTELTLGEQNWVYTGMAEVDTVPSALIENTVTQDGVFLKQGERWKQAVVFQITPDELTLVGPDGMHHYVKVLGSEEPATTMPAGVMPLAVTPPPNLQGPIGGANPGPAIQIQPVPGGGRNPGVNNVR
jgi:hypothetical protein